MTLIEVKNLLDYTNATRESRGKMATMAMENPGMVPLLLAIAKENKTPLSSRAAWVLEFAIVQNRELALPYMDELTDSLLHMQLDSCIRPLAKICEYLAKDYFATKPNMVQQTLNGEHLEKIVEACFDWLLGQHKIAPQAYSMQTLFLLGQKFDWIHPELRGILERNYAQGSAGYRARARKILAKIQSMDM
ncbi:MAG: adenylosuccinate lyase [Flavobacteriaceae bacterium]